jgi:hypothetical protein
MSENRQMRATPATSARPRSKFGSLALAVDLGMALWMTIVFYSRVTDGGDTGIDTGLYLSGLSALIAVFVFLQARRSPSSAADIGLAPLAVSQTNSAPAHSRPANPAIIGAWAASGIGVDALKFTETLAARSYRPTPDECLLDDDGLPVMSSRVKNLDTTRVRASLEQLVKDGALEGIGSGQVCRDAVLRALSLLDMVLNPVQKQWRPDTDPTRQTGPFRLRVKLIVPAGLSYAERRFAEHYLATRLHGLQRPGQQITSELVAGDEGPLAFEQVRTFILDSARASAPEALLLLACDSALCDSVIADWSSRRCLFEPRRPDGLMAGEGAFALLCANPDAAGRTAHDVLCEIAGLSFAQREASADGPGDVSHARLALAISAALRAADTPADSIAGVVCDTDHRASRTLESLFALGAQTPHLDGVQHRLATNEACGHLGAASATAALVAGAVQASRCRQPILIFSGSHPVQRAAAVMIVPSR